MKIKFSCTQCQQSYSVKPELAGKSAKCKKCAAPMQIPRAPKPTTKAPVIAELVAPAPQPARPTEVVSAPPGTPTPQRIQPIIAAQLATPAETEAPAVASVKTALPASGLSNSTAPSAAPRQSNKVIPQFSASELLAGITQPIEPVPTTFTYRLAALTVALVMVILPVVYVGLIVLFAFGVFQYATHGLAIFDADHGRSSRGGLALLLLYVGPLVVGTVTVLFMIKPLFARAPKSTGHRSLDRAAEPKLFDFVDKLCEAVHAPKPSRIDVNCDVNASASFGRGLFSVLFSRDLVLTIGTPLAAGLSARELAGVFAHEFGHFSQGFGMRLSYLVRSISHWFARVVYERDAWDEWLANSANALDLRIGIVLHLARIAIWFTRRILWVLMMIGNVVSSALLRQMEYDADLHEIRFSGSKTFETTAVQLQRLNLAFQQSVADQQQFFRDGKLAANMPALTAFNRDEQERKIIDALLKSALEEKTQWLASHPCDHDRVAQARNENEPGVFQLAAPASALFSNWNATCIGCTRDWLAEILEDDFKNELLAPTAAILSHKAASRHAEEARNRMFGSYFRVPRLMQLATAISPPAASSPWIQKLRSSRETMIQLLPDYSSDSQKLDKADTLWMTCQQLSALQQLGAKLKQKDFDIPVGNTAETDRVGEDARNELMRLSEENLQQLETSFEKRLLAASNILQASDIALNLDAPHQDILQRTNNISNIMPMVQASLADATKARNSFAVLSMQLNGLGSGDLTQEQVSQIETVGETVRQLCCTIKQRFGDARFPFDHSSDGISMADYLMPKTPQPEQFGDILVSAEKLVDGYHYIYFRCLGELALMIQQVESAIGLPPQPDPPEPTNEESPSPSS